MSRQALDAFRRTITVEWPKKQNEDAKQLLIRTARNGHGKIMQEQTSRSGIPPDWNAYANQPGNTNLESVIIPGPIVYKYRYLREVVLATIDALERASPIDSGDYARSHTIYLDGVAYGELPSDISDVGEIMISNTVPYSRRLEVGVTKGGRPFVIDVEPNIYERTLIQVRPKFRNVAKMLFTFATLPNAYTITGGMGRRTPRYKTGAAPGARGGGTLRKRATHAGEKVRSPAIVIEAL